MFYKWSLIADEYFECADADMQLEIDTHISNGQAMFNVLMLVGFFL